VKAGALRVMLPPWPGGDAAGVQVRFGYRQPDGTWRDGGLRTLEGLVEKFAAKRIEVCLHPGDVPMAMFTLPPLSGARMRAAVRGAIEPCALQPLENLVTGFGPRAADGTVPAAWVSRAVMDGWLALLRKHGLQVRELHLPCAFLPYSAEAGIGCRVDRWLVVRTGKSQGFVQWLPEGMGGPAADVQWLGEEEADRRWSGEGWSWSLAGGESAAGSVGAALAGPAVGWGALALAVWLTGLNVYAHQLAAQGQGLKRQMAARVKAAFPDIPVVVNPVQQAKQQKDALAAGAAPTASADAASLLRATATLLAQTPAGQVQGLRYTAGQLHIRWRDGGAPGAEDRRALQARAAEQRLSANADADGLRVTAATAAAEDASARKATP
jgi:general secretion pathway protein L